MCNFEAKFQPNRNVQHYSTHFINKLGKSLEPFFNKVQKTANNGKKGQKRDTIGILAILGKNNEPFLR